VGTFEHNDEGEHSGKRLKYSQEIRGGWSEQPVSFAGDIVPRKFEMSHTGNLIENSRATIRLHLTGKN
jgi:hypothetical protein